MKVEESLNVTFDESPPPTKLSPLVGDDVGKEEAIKNNTKVVNNNNEEDKSIEVDEVVNIKESKNYLLDQYIKEMLKKFGLEDYKPTKTPMSTKIKLYKDDEADFVDSSKYRVDRFTFHERVMDPLDISKNARKEKGKKIASPSVTSSSSLLFDDNEAQSFLEFYDELSDNKDLTKAQREKRGMFKCLNCYVSTITKYLKKQE
ncbi:hypothetical protein Tco_0356714 [Tanacetum coccineum]